MLKIGFISLGCSKNQVDTEVMLHKVLTEGFEITPDENEADIIVINTCAFVESAKQESIDNILDVARLKESNRLRGIVVTGCLAERYREHIFEELPEVDAIVGVGSLQAIAEAVRSAAEGKKFAAFGDKNTPPAGGERVLTTPDYTAYLKIAEGCDNRCTYCAIPLIRGNFRSRTMEDILKEAKQLEAIGVRELCVIAQDTTRYGLDLYGTYKLPELLRRLTDETKIPWIRILYCYPDKITDALIAEIRDNDRVVKYIDIPVQHISDRILTRMNRRGDSALIRATIEKLRREIPGVVLRTTAIVGFPGEREEDFQMLRRFIRETRFERFGAFTYSREEDTPAYDFEEQIDPEVMQARYDSLMREQQRVIEALNQGTIGRVLTVLCEGYDPESGLHFGRSYADAPDIDGKVYFSADKRITPGEFVKVTISGAAGYDLAGECLGAK